MMFAISCGLAWLAPSNIFGLGAQPLNHTNYRHPSGAVQQQWQRCAGSRLHDDALYM
jgi:hypothetical protein